MKTSTFALAALAGLPLLAACSSDRPYDRTEQPSASYRDDNRMNHDYRTDTRDYSNQPAYRDQAPAEHASSFSFNHVTGNMSTTVDANVDRVWVAAQDALNDLHFTTEEKKSENDKSVLKGKTSDNDSVKVTLERRGEKMTEIIVGVGPMGKEATADLVLQKILDRVR